ncbi:HK97 family phage prohead protease [Treponema denticola OTK]|uniref:HK97 family phage prohead protease n=1 Tax=Treponema denticola OTK TaxID=999434 RepID=A0A0F6MMW6_TREDN|nr:HK97 family phage prohead protease [Treponema denticola]EMB20704.1 HK97 family phage prohead protease [Treponema denticola OTK]
MKKKILRNLKTNFSTRDDNGERWITGLIPYNSKSENLNPFGGEPIFEVIEETAFKKTLADKAEVRALFYHDVGKVLGSTKSGTLELESTKEGLICRCKVPNTTWGNDAFEIINRGDVTTMSFGFIPFEVETRGNTDYLKSVKLEEVSFCVATPAYEETSSSTLIRSLFENIDLENLSNVINGKKEMEDTDIKTINNLIEKLEALLPVKKEEENKEMETEETETQEKETADEKEQSDDTLKENDTETLEALQLLCEMELNN